MRWLHWGRIAVVALAGFAWVASGCSEANDSHSDISDDDIDVDMTPWTIVANFDGYPNVAIRCAGADRLYTTTRSDNPLIVVPNAADCRGGGG